MTTEEKPKPTPKPKPKQSEKKSMDRKIVEFGRVRVIKSCGILGFGEEVSRLAPPEEITGDSLRNLEDAQKLELLEHLNKSAATQPPRK